MPLHPIYRFSRHPDLTENYESVFVCGVTLRDPIGLGYIGAAVLTCAFQRHFSIEPREAVTAGKYNSKTERSATYRSEVVTVRTNDDSSLKPNWQSRDSFSHPSVAI